MEQIADIETVGQYNEIANHTTAHPLISVIDFSKLVPGKRESPTVPVQAIRFGFYAIFYKNNRHCEIKYGRNYYDYQAGTLVFIAPGQVVSIEENGEDYQPSGYALLFHPDILRGSSLAQSIKNYNFFSYDVHEALHLADDEKQVIIDCFKKMEYELSRTVDKHSKKLILSNLELILNYCMRFYDRQFITRDHANPGIAEKFVELIDAYFLSDKCATDGIPTVTYFANAFHFSANYFGDLIKKETGRSAIDHIHTRLIETAKEKISAGQTSISEIAYELGFKYPQHFTRLFKQKVGLTPMEFRSSKN